MNGATTAAGCGVTRVVDGGFCRARFALVDLNPLFCALHPFIPMPSTVHRAPYTLCRGRTPSDFALDIC